MARTAEQVLVTIAAQQLHQIAQLQAKVESQAEELAALKAHQAIVSQPDTPPTE